MSWSSKKYFSRYKLYGGFIHSERFALSGAFLKTYCTQAFAPLKSLVTTCIVYTTDLEGLQVKVNLVIVQERVRYHRTGFHYCYILLLLLMEL